MPNKSKKIIINKTKEIVNDKTNKSNAKTKEMSEEDLMYLTYGRRC